MTLQDAVMRLGLNLILSYTSETNLRSQAVMERVGMTRRPDKDFTALYDGYGAWHGLVWQYAAAPQDKA